MNESKSSQFVAIDTPVEAPKNPAAVVEIPETLESLQSMNDFSAICDYVFDHPQELFSIPLQIKKGAEPLITLWKYDPLLLPDEGIEFHDLKVNIPVTGETLGSLRYLKLTTDRIRDQWITKSTYVNKQAEGEKYIYGARWLWAMIDDAWNQKLANKLQAPIKRKFDVKNPVMESVPRALTGFSSDPSSNGIWTKTYEPELEM